MDLRQEVNKLSENRRKYFLWKNKMDTKQTNYSKWTLDDFMKSTNLVDRSLSSFLLWEDSEEYKRLEFKLTAERFNSDILDVYRGTVEQAKQGNSSAVKVMFDLQKKINNKLDFYYPPEEEETGLKLDV